MDQFWANLLHEFHTPFSNNVLIFSLILFIILFVPLFFNRVKIPGIIGLIVSGVVIGPHGLYLIKKSSAVDLFSTIGLLYIMFIAGLELDMGEFRKNKNKSVVFGILTFIIPLALGLPVCYYVLGYGLETSFLTASMFATHTLIAYPIVNRLGISKSRAVPVAVGGTILTDTAVLILLAIISGSHGAGLTSMFWGRLGISVLIFTLIIIFVIPRVSSWFFKRMEDEKNAHFIFVLSVVFFCAFLAELSGLEPIIGAFAAGLSLNRLIPHTSSLMNRIEFVGNSLFIPFFLISVGMLIDVSVLANGFDAILIALTLTAVALLSKWFAAKLTGKIFAFTRAESNIIFGLSSAHAAATLAVILVGYRIGLIDDNILNGTIILILITCVVASFITERAGKKVLLEMDTLPQIPESSQRILIPIANPLTMERLIDFGIMMKNPREPFPLMAVTVVKDGDQAQEKLIQSKKLLDKAILHAAAADQRIEITATIDRNVTSGLKRVIKEKFITDIILGWSEDKGIADIIFGKTFDAIVKQTSQTIFITRFVLPLNIQQRLIVVCPEFAEKERGFLAWVLNLTRLSVQLQAPIQLIGTDETYRQVKLYFEGHRLAIPLRFTGMKDLFQFLQASDVQELDMIVLVSSRVGGISYNSGLDVLPKKLSKRFGRNNIIFVYPEISTEDVQNFDEDVSGGILEKGLNIFKGAKKIFGG